MLKRILRAFGLSSPEIGLTDASVWYWRIREARRHGESA